MTIKNLSHVALGVRDIERQLTFWTDNVGLHVSLDSIEEVPGPDGTGTVRRRAVYLRDAEGAHEPFIVLDQLMDGDSPGEAKALFDVGVHHFGFWVDDVDSIAKRMVDADVPIVIGPVDSGTDRYGEPEGAYVRTLLVRDPDGNVIQFDQRVAGVTEVGNGK